MADTLVWTGDRFLSLPTFLVIYGGMDGWQIFWQGGGTSMEESTSFFGKHLVDVKFIIVCWLSEVCDVLRGHIASYCGHNCRAWSTPLLTG